MVGGFGFPKPICDVLIFANTQEKAIATSKYFMAPNSLFKKLFTVCIGNDTSRVAAFFVL